jgi:hypothetical protein
MINEGAVFAFVTVLIVQMPFNHFGIPGFSGLAGIEVSTSVRALASLPPSRLAPFGHDDDDDDDGAGRRKQQQRSNVIHDSVFRTKNKQKSISPRVGLTYLLGR